MSYTLTAKDEVELADLVRAIRSEVQGRINALERADAVNEAFLSAHYDALHALETAACKLDAIYTTRIVAIDEAVQDGLVKRRPHDGG